MKGLLNEILEIPQKAEDCLRKNSSLQLPTKVPYIGMGSSYFAPLTLYYCGANISPQIASEFYYYLSPEKRDLGVLISQSGESSETVWCMEKFNEIISIVNNPQSSLGKASRIRNMVEIVAGNEQYSSTKTYVNTLIALFCGLGINPEKGVKTIQVKFSSYNTQMKLVAATISNYLSTHKINGLYVVGSGPNIGTAYEAALTLSETTKLAWIGMPIAQYDHGPKETADNTVVIILNGMGKGEKRINSIKQTLSKNSNSCVIEIMADNLDERLTVLPLIVQMNFLMNYLADELHVGSTFQLGSKVTTLDSSIK